VSVEKSVVGSSTMVSVAGSVLRGVGLTVVVLSELVDELFAFVLKHLAHPVGKPT
jgi:hypothetical protein